MNERMRTVVKGRFMFMTALMVGAEPVSCWLLNPAREHAVA